MTPREILLLIGGIALGFTLYPMFFPAKQGEAVRVVTVYKTVPEQPESAAESDPQGEPESEPESEPKPRKVHSDKPAKQRKEANNDTA